MNLSGEPDSGSGAGALPDFGGCRPRHAVCVNADCGLSCCGCCCPHAAPGFEDGLAAQGQDGFQAAVPVAAGAPEASCAGRCSVHCYGSPAAHFSAAAERAVPFAGSAAPAARSSAAEVRAAPFAGWAAPAVERRVPDAAQPVQVLAVHPQVPFSLREAARYKVRQRGGPGQRRCPGTRPALLLRQPPAGHGSHVPTVNGQSVPNVPAPFAG
jgi:hypothetical protein